MTRSRPFRLRPSMRTRCAASSVAGPAIFAADDSLGWTYQFWRAAEKKAVNESQVKIGAAELPAVTQLFTEPYMVRFLLHNTLGAWWAGKVLASWPELAREAADERALRVACALPGYEWDYLRFVREDGVWRPAAGIFPGWPARAAEITVLDPCCGSGHFLTEALASARRPARRRGGVVPGGGRDRRAARQSARAGDRRALRADRGFRTGADRLAHRRPGNEIADAAYRLGRRTAALPKAEFVALANGDAELQRGLAALHDLFRQAPLLGSLIELTGGDLVDPTRIARLDESIAALVEKMRGPNRSGRKVRWPQPRGMADAAAILARRFTLQVTNVPFLGLSKATDTLQTYVQEHFLSGISMCTSVSYYGCGGYGRIQEQLRL